MTLPVAMYVIRNQVITAVNTCIFKLLVVGMVSG